MAVDIGLRKGERTRQRLIEAARREFSRSGYLNAEVSEISKAAGKSAGAFYIYFENKAAVLDALIDEFERDVHNQPIDTSEEFYSRFDADAVVRRLQILWDTHSVHAATFYALAQAAMIDPHFYQRNREVRLRAVEDFRGMIAGRQSRGFCRGLDVVFGAINLETLLVNCLYECQSVGAAEFQAENASQRTFQSLAHIVKAALEFDVATQPPDGGPPDGNALG